MESKSEFKHGDIVKKDLTSRESWTVVEEENGKLMLHPNINTVFRDTKILDLEEEIIKDDFLKQKFIRLANISGLDFSTYTSGWREK